MHSYNFAHGPDTITTLGPHSYCEVLGGGEGVSIQGYLVHKKTPPPPQDYHRTLVGICLL